MADQHLSIGSVEAEKALRTENEKQKGQEQQEVDGALEHVRAPAAKGEHADQDREHQQDGVIPVQSQFDRVAADQPDNQNEWDGERKRR